MGPRHRYTISTKHNLSQSLFKLRRYKEAAKLEQEVIEWRAEVLGSRHPETMSAKHSHVITLRKLARHKEADEIEQGMV